MRLFLPVRLEPWYPCIPSYYDRTLVFFFFLNCFGQHFFFFPLCSFLFLPQDLEEEGLAVRVGSLGVRWVLMEHAEPWLLTVSSKHAGQPDVSRSADPQQAGAFRSKRCRRHTARQVGEPPAKRTEKDGREGEDAEELSREGEETENREREDEEASLDREEGGELQGNTEGTEAREQEPPAEETPESSSAPPEAADADDE